jgi:hypothetical protein
MRTDHGPTCPGNSPGDPAPRRTLRWVVARMVRATAIPLMALAGIALAPTEDTAATITYFIQNYPADQNGFDVTGTITTDGTTGLLSPSDILSWSVTIPGEGTFSGGSRDLTLNGLEATPTQITLPLPTGEDTITSLDLFTFPSDLVYDRLSTHSAYFSQFDASLLWQTVNPSMGNAGTNAWLIAAVPEPSSLVLELVAAGIVIASAMVRKPRPQRRRGEAGKPPRHE